MFVFKKFMHGWLFDWRKIGSLKLLFIKTNDDLFDISHVLEAVVCFINVAEIVLSSNDTYQLNFYVDEFNNVFISFFRLVVSVKERRRLVCQNGEINRNKNKFLFLFFDFW